MDFAHLTPAKDIEGLTLLVLAVLGSVTLLCMSHRARDVALFLIMGTLVINEKFSINFFSKWWYRGSTRGLEVTLEDILAISLLISSILFPKKGRPRWRWPAGMGFMLLFLFYACAATLAIEPRAFSIFELTKIARGLIFLAAFAMAVRSERELGICVLALACATCLEGGLVVRQRWMYALDRVAGSLGHPNSLSMYLCMVGPILVAALNSTLPRLIRWTCACALASAGLAIILTVSRAGVPTFALVVVAATAWTMSWRITLKKVAVFTVVATGVGLVGFKYWGLLKERFNDSSLSEEYLDTRTVDSRGYYLRLARLIVEDRFFGVGLNNWSYAVSKKYGAMMKTPYADYDWIPDDLNNDEDMLLNFAAPAHNLGALTLGELGLPGLILFLLVWVRWLQMGASFLWRRKRTTMHVLAIGIFFGMVGVFLQSITEWIFRQTAIYLMFHALIGTLATMYAARRLERRRLEERLVSREELVPISAGSLTPAMFVDLQPLTPSLS
jgi:O-antigen ligase